MWTGRKKRLDQCRLPTTSLSANLEKCVNNLSFCRNCSNFSAFIRSVRQVLDWLSSTGESYLSSHPVRDIKNISKDVAQEWLEDNKKFREEAKVLFYFLTKSKNDLSLSLSSCLRGWQSEFRVMPPNIIVVPFSSVCRKFVIKSSYCCNWPILFYPVGITCTLRPLVIGPTMWI